MPQNTTKMLQFSKKNATKSKKMPPKNATECHNLLQNCHQMPRKCHLKFFIEASDAAASIDGQGLSADEGCVLGGQERDGLGNLVRPTWPSERMNLLALL
jgi:hypothetical protein